MCPKGGLAGLLAAVGIAAVACGGSGSPAVEGFPTVLTLGGGEVYPVVLNRTLAVGDNRFSFGLMDGEERPILGADVHLGFFDLSGPEPVLKSETEARFIPIDLFFIDEQSGGRKTSTGEGGAYVAGVRFDTAGRWGVRISVAQGGSDLGTVPFQFDVLTDSPEPDIGDPAPPSRQLTLADAADVSEIDSSVPARPHMHDITVADALATGKPIVIAFATPAFCTSRTCGPVMDTVMDPLYAEYRDRALFIHIEPYKLRELRENIDEIPVAAMAEWGLETEPWLFVVDKQGRIAGKFEGIVARDEVEEVLTRVLDGDGAG